MSLVIQFLLNKRHRHQIYLKVSWLSPHHLSPQGFSQTRIQRCRSPAGPLIHSKTCLLNRTLLQAQCKTMELWAQGTISNSLQTCSNNSRILWPCSSSRWQCYSNRWLQCQWVETLTTLRCNRCRLNCKIWCRWCSRWWWIKTNSEWASSLSPTAVCK